MYWLCFLFFLSTSLEISLGQLNIPLPMTILACFYTTVSYSWKHAVFPTLCATALVDLWYARTMPLAMTAIPFTLLLGTLWRLRGNSRDAYLQLCPGLLLGLNAVALSTLYLSLHFYSLGLGIQFPGMLYAAKCLFFTAVALPVFVLALDKGARAFGKRRYCVANHDSLSSEEWERP